MHQAIDWFSWLSKTGLDPSLIYEYGMSFSRNELEEADIAYFNHEFLQSMGISIAKHRLEILKLARKKQNGSGGSHPISKLMVAIKKTKRTVVNYFHTWVHPDDSALVLVRRSYGSGWKGAMLRTNRRMVTFKQANPTLLLTNGYHKSNSVRVNGISNSLVYGLEYDQGKKDSFDGDHRDSSDEEDGGGGGGGGGGDGGGYLSGNGVKEIKWDTLFQNLKPT